jgi:hypothetical protein
LSDVETVALWLGLVSGVISIVLAIVAMTFTFAVDRRSSKINEQMIGSLQKIESTVEGVADDTTGLIKVAWERMLPGGSADPSPVAADRDNDEESIRAIAAGVAAELKSELVPQSGLTETQAVDRIDKALRRLERSVEAQLSSGVSETSSRLQRLSRVEQTLEKLNPEARELLGQLSRGGPLTRTQYMQLRMGPLGPAMAELRHYALIAPLREVSAEENAEPVYFMSPSINRLVRPILSLLDPVPRLTREHVASGLRAVGYTSKPVRTEQDRTV